MILQSEYERELGHKGLKVLLMILTALAVAVVLSVVIKEGREYISMEPASVINPEPVIDPHQLLTAPDDNSQSQETYVQAIESVAVATDTITLTEGCTMSPLIVRLPENSVLNIHNTDTTEHTIAFEDQNFFNVSPGQMRAINLTETFGKKIGIYRYKCNDISLERNVGIMYVSEAI